MRKRRSRIMITALLVLTVIFTTFPQGGRVSYAASGEPSVNMGAGVLSAKANNDDAPTVYLSDKAWRVIGYDGTGVAGKEGVMTLLSSVKLADTKFSSRTENVNNYYADSDIKIETDKVAAAFNEAEKSYIVPRTLVSGSYSGDETDCVAGSEVKDALLWPLSIKEANATNKSVRTLPTAYWWLRSPGDRTMIGSSVWYDGTVDGKWMDVYNVSLGIRPALHFSTDPVVLTSAATGGKVSGELGPDALTAVEPNTSGEWKFTLMDAAHENFAVGSSWSCDGKDLHIKYSGANTGSNEYLSAMIVKTDGTVSYYGRLCRLRPDSSTGEVKVIIDGKMDNEDKLYLFNEQLNGDKKSDFASEPKEVSMPLTTGHEWEFYSVHWEGSKTDGYTAAAVNYRCKRDNDHTQSVEAAFTSKVTKEPGCETDGETQYTAQVVTGPDTTGRMFQNTAGVPKAKGHDWDTPTYTWAEDNNKATAEHYCKNDSSHHETETVDTAAEVTRQATCTEKGETTYTAVFIKAGFETQTKTVDNIESTGHDWEFKGFTWTGDADQGYTGCSANYTCKNDVTHTTTVPVEIAEEQESKASCTEDGRTKYSVELAAADSPDKAAHKDTVDAAVPKATGHDWRDPEYTWSDDDSEVTAKRICGNDQAHIESETAEVKTKVTKRPTCKERGETTYTATFENEAFGKQTKTLADIRELGHDWDDGEVTKEAKCSEEGERTFHCLECDAVKTEKIARTAHALTKHSAVRPTCEESGHSAYWSCENCGKIFSDKSSNSEIDEEDTVLPATGHDFRYTGMTWADDKSSATANFVCRHDAEHTDTAAAEVTSETVDSTYDSRGITVYTATVVYDGVKYTESKTEGIDPKKREDQGGDSTPEPVDGKPADGTDINPDADGGKPADGTDTNPGADDGKPADGTDADPGADDGKPADGTDADPGADNGKTADVTDVGKGASAAAAEKAITNAASDEGLKGTEFSRLRLRSVTQTNNSVTLKWNKLSGAVRYVIYGNRCGTSLKMKRFATVKGMTSKKITKAAGKKLKTGKSYKFIIVALDKNGKVVSTSKVLHVVTKGGKTGNYKSVSVKNAVINKAKSLKKGKSLKIGAKAVKTGLKVNVHRGVRYESTNTAVATVTAKGGIVKGKKKGSCYIYAYAQSGVYRKIKVTVK